MAETLPSAEQRLLEAKLALHKLMTGATEVAVGYGDRSLTFRSANIADLQAYIRQLEGEIGDDSTKRRPFGVIWG